LGEGDVLPEEGGGLPRETVNSLRIGSLFLAYGTGFIDSIRFYAGEGGAACVQNDLAVWAGGAEADLEAWAAFLPMTASSVLTETPLPIKGARRTCGKSFRLSSPPAARQENVSRNLWEGCEVLGRIFSEHIREESFPRWYADLSHRIRHGAAGIYVLEGACAAVCCLCHGRAGLLQLGVLPERRREGLARRVLSHLAADTGAGEILVQSQGPQSDGFYEALGFAPDGTWFLYERG